MHVSEFFTVKEVASQLRLNPITIYEYIRARKLIAVKFGRYYRISHADLIRFIRQQKLR